MRDHVAASRGRVWGTKHVRTRLLPLYNLLLPTLAISTFVANNINIYAPNCGVLIYNLHAHFP